MLVKEGVAYLQAGVGFLEKLVCGGCANQPHQGGIVFDSDPYDEWMETINKLGAAAQPRPDSVVCLLINKRQGRTCNASRQRSKSTSTSKATMATMATRTRRRLDRKQVQSLMCPSRRSDAYPAWAVTLDT